MTPHGNQMWFAGRLVEKIGVAHCCYSALLFYGRTIACFNDDVKGKISFWGDYFLSYAFTTCCKRSKKVEIHGSN